MFNLVSIHSVFLVHTTWKTFTLFYSKDMYEDRLVLTPTDNMLHIDEQLINRWWEWGGVMTITLGQAGPLEARSLQSH